MGGNRDALGGHVGKELSCLSFCRFIGTPSTLTWDAKVRMVDDKDRAPSIEEHMRKFLEDAIRVFDILKDVDADGV